MFHRWGFLLTEIWVLLLLAALLGLVVGWLIWGRSAVVAPDTTEADRLRADLTACQAKGRDQAARIATLEGDLTAAKTAAESAPPKPQVPPAAPVKSEPAATEAKTPEKASVETPAKPATLAAPRGGKADDLKLIKGVGPKMEALLNRLGFFHFDQIAGWTAKDVAWVDENLEAFRGRASREDWVAQARDLAAGKPPRAGGET